MHAVVTGASAGIGEALVRELSRRGYDVTLVARRRDVLERIASELSTRTHVVVRDLTDVEAAPSLLEEAEAALGPIDVFVSNAGFMTLGAVATFDPKEAERLVAINFLTPIRLLGAALPKMIARGRGTVVNVTSIAAFVAPPGWAHQSATKTASAIFSETLRSELRGTGVHALTVYPGLNDTAMKHDGLSSYESDGIVKYLPVGDPATFARKICEGIAKKKRRIVFPTFYWLVRWFPRISQCLSDRFAPRLGPSRPSHEHA